MKLLDVNVLLAAHRDDHPHSGVARPWLERMLVTGESFCVSDLAAGAFVRIASNRRIFITPTAVEDAFAYLVALRAQPGHRLLAPGRHHLDLLEQLCREAEASGDLVPDAQLGALAVEHGGEVVSLDRDFARFERVRWSRPEA